MSKQRRPDRVVEIGGVEVSVYAFKDEEYVPVRAFCKLTGRRDLSQKNLINEVAQLDPEGGQWFHNVSNVMKLDVFLEQLERHKHEKLDEARVKLAKHEDLQREFWPMILSLTKAMRDLSQAQLEHTNSLRERIAVDKALHNQSVAVSQQITDFRALYLTIINDGVDKPDEADEAEQPKGSKKRSRK